MASNDDRFRQLEHENEQLRRAAVIAQQRADNEAQRADNEAQARAAEKQRADDAQARKQRTIFFEYIDNIHTCISPALRVETDPTKAAKGKAANANGKVYPLTLRRWEAFPQLHRQFFDDLTTLFGDDRLFPSSDITEATAANLSPRNRRDEQDIRPYIRAYLEEPASQIVNAFLKQTTRPEYARLEFQFSNNALGTVVHLEADPFMVAIAQNSGGGHGLSRNSSGSSSQKRKLDSISSLAPDRWGLCLQRDQSGREYYVGILPGEYKAAHKMRAGVFGRILANDDAPLAESFIDDCARRVGDVQRDAVTIAEVLCQAFHYMIVFGRPHGYVTSGEGTLLLLAAPETPGTLLYHYIDHAAVALPITQPETDLMSVPAAQLATLVSLALVADKYPAATTTHLLDSLPRWPSPATKVQRVGPSDPPRDRSPSRDDGDGDDDDDNDDGRGRGTDRPPPPPPSIGGRGNSLAPPYSGDLAGSGASGVSGGQSRPFDRFETPRSQYCTQRCLLGLCRGGQLDPKCPNTPEHASGERRATGADGQPCHAISAADVCTMLLEQFTKSLSAGLECLMGQGLFGTIGTLFKVTLCAYGYTFVAKGVQDRHQHILQKEASFYADPATQHLQGMLMPVYLGCIELEEYPYILPTGALIWHMMFLSWAGESLAKRVPDCLRDVDMDDVVYDVHVKLYHHGIYHQDVYETNLAWNTELGRVMAIDFDRAFVMTEEEYNETPPPLPPVTDTFPGALMLIESKFQAKLKAEQAKEVKEAKQAKKAKLAGGIATPVAADPDTPRAEKRKHEGGGEDDVEMKRMQIEFAAADKPVAT